MATRPTITVLMPLLEAHRFASESIESVLGQTFNDFELVIVAAGQEAVEAGVADMTDSRLRLLVRETSELADALNVGLDAATGDFIARQDPDGLCLPERLARQVDIFGRDPTLAIVGSAWEWVDENGTITSAEAFFPRSDADVRWRALFAPPFAPTSVMFRASVLHERGLRWDEQTPTPAIDFRFQSEVLRPGRAASIPCPLVRVRYRSGELLESLEEDVAYARVARRNVADLGIDLGRSNRLIGYSVDNRASAPPSTTSVCPVTKDERCPSSRKTIASATSCGFPMRFKGVRATRHASASRRRPNRLRSAGVSIAPGSTAFTRTPASANSSAAARVSATRPPLLAAYAATEAEVATA